MSAYLPWLLFLACPLMMMFMMRGMGSGKDRRKMGAKDDPYGDALTRDYPKGDFTPNGAVGQQARIEQLESEVAELRAAGKRPPGSSESRR